MRITNSMMVNTLLKNMNGNLRTMDKYTTQLGTQRRITRLSDDAIGVLNSMNARKRLLNVQQYQDNVVAAASYVNQTDSSLQEMSKMVTEIRTNLIDASTDIKMWDDREKIAKIVDEYKNHITQSIGNTAVGGKYIFAGYNSTKQPFTVDGTGKVLYNGVDIANPDIDMSKTMAQIEAEELIANPALDPTDPTTYTPRYKVNKEIRDELEQNFQLEVGTGLKMDVSFNGAEIMGVGKDSIFYKLDQLLVELNNPAADISKLSGFIKDLDDFSQHNLQNLSTVGARETRLELLENRYGVDEINYTDNMSSIEDIDVAEVITKYLMADSVYKAALQTGAKVIMPTLMDFLR